MADRLLESIREERRGMLKRLVPMTGTGELTISSSGEINNPRVMELKNENGKSYDIRNGGSNSNWE